MTVGPGGREPRLFRVVAPAEETQDALAGGPPERRRRRVRAPGRRQLVSSGRWRLVGIGAIAAVALAVAVPRLSLHADVPPDRAIRPPTVGDARDAVAVRWPLRGDLAGDDAFVRAAIRRLERDHPATRRAIYAGRLPDGSRLLMATAAVDPGATPTTVAALHTTAGQTPSAGTVSPVAALTDPAQVLGWAAAGRSGTVYAVALGPPQPLRLEISARVDVGADGVPRRDWQTKASASGVVLADLGARTDPSVAVRSLGPAPYLTPVLIPITGRAVTPARDLVVGGVDEATYRGPDRRLLVQGLVAMTKDLLDLGTATTRVIWSGAPWQGRRLALVLITRPGGARLQAVVGEQDGRWFPAGVRPLPTRERGDVPWLLEPFSSGDPTLLLCPTGEGDLDYLREDHPPIPMPIRAGVATLLEPGYSPLRVGGARVRLRDRDGAVILTTRLPTTGFDDALAVRRQ